MRTTQYVFVLLTQVFLLCAMFAFGAKVIDMSPFQGVTSDTSGVQQAPPGQGLDDLRDQLSR